MTRSRHPYRVLKMKLPNGSFVDSDTHLFDDPLPPIGTVLNRQGDGSYRVLNVDDPIQDGDRLVYVASVEGVGE